MSKILVAMLPPAGPPPGTGLDLAGISAAAGVPEWRARRALRRLYLTSMVGVSPDSPNRGHRPPTHQRTDRFALTPYGMEQARICAGQDPR